VLLLTDLHFLLEKLSLLHSENAIFLECVDRGIWDDVINGRFIPMITINDIQETKPFAQWTINGSRRDQ